MRHMLAALAALVLATAVVAQTGPTAKPAPKPAPKPAGRPAATPIDEPNADGWYNVGLMAFGAAAKGSGAPFNKDWPPNGTLVAGLGRGGTLIGNPMKGGRVDIRLIVPVDIKALDLVGLDYNGTRQPKAVDIYVDGKLVKQTELPDNPGKPNRVALEAHGQAVGIVITDEYPIRDLPGGKQGPSYGGWARLWVYSSTNVPAMLQANDQYQTVAAPVDIAPTSASASEGKVEVTGEPRTTQGHPCTLWDSEDIAHIKDMLRTSKELQAQVAGLTHAMDVRIAQPIGVPPPQKGPDGQWRHISDLEMLNGSTYGSIHNQLALDIANLGTIYALTGDAKYAEFCKKILLAYADAYPDYAVGARPGFAHSPSKLFDQTLGDAIVLPQIARGYDLIHDAATITPEERKHIENDFIGAVARYIIKNHSMLESYTNWSAIGTCAVLTAGYAIDDQELVDTALYGIRGTKERPTGGLYDRHFGPEAIDKDGMWAEGAMGYQFMALNALIMDAEVLWHHGIDMYRYRDCALKRLFDSPIYSSYPDLTTPAIHDSGHDSIISGESFLYEYAYRRYHDPSYLLILNQAGKHFDAHFQQYAVSILYDRDTTEKAAPVEWKSVNLFGVGYGILRLTNAAGTNSLLLEYGPDRSHGHPDKLTIDLYAFNDQLIIDPGSVWYELPLYRQWYHTTLGHSTLTVDELDQTMCRATQLVYGPADTFAIERASCDAAYPGVTMDRAVFLTPNYMADIFGAFTKLPRKFDLAWHIRGQFASDLKLDPMTFPPPVEDGYSALTNVRHASTDQPWSATISRAGHNARFVAAGGQDTEIIVGDGHYGLETPPTILERRTKGATVYGNAVDISDARDPYVKSVTQEGSLDAGYGLLKVHTVKGTDLCFTSYRPGTYQAGDLETDAQQAFVLMDGANIQAMYLGGGKTLKVGATTLVRNEPGLAYLEKTDTGAYILANPSPAEANITVAFAPLAGMEAYTLDNEGRRTGKQALDTDKEGVYGLTLKPLAKVEFAPKGAPSVFDYRQDMLAKRQAAQEAALTKARDECVARTKVRVAEAAAKPVPANTIIAVRAVDFTGEGGGKVTLSDKKRGALGKCFLGWNDVGHWIEWTIDVPTAGYYNLTLCYCSDLDLIERQIMVNGEVQEPFATMVFPSTGGWANGSDDWRLFTAQNPTNNQPLMVKFKAGKNVLRLTNLNGRGINVDYLLVTSPDVRPTRDQAAARLK